MSQRVGEGIGNFTSCEAKQYYLKVDVINEKCIPYTLEQPLKTLRGNTADTLKEDKMG